MARHRSKTYAGAALDYGERHSRSDVEVVAMLFSVVQAHDKALITESEAKDQLWHLALAEIEARERETRRARR